MKIRRLATTAATFDAELEQLLHWSEETDAGIETTVAQIIADVRRDGDAIVLALTQKFDGVQAASVADLAVSPAELKAAFDGLPEVQRQALQVAAERVRRYHQR